ncbi:hypothetical protein BsIDN1_20190 [Bacillus safensis]|uniref:Uncharacterized protein n=1 Tax=Bacillus safensis TaxID=561879 RepID=A0A5S9M644_BACIA|nr:hypothetical protein BsIDN1_20190 [Bacillus safensis]
MVAKMLSEYMYEDMLHPVELDCKDGIAQYELIIHEHKKYRYLAKPRLFDSFDTIAESIECCQDGKWSKGCQCHCVFTRHSADHSNVF